MLQFKTTELLFRMFEVDTMRIIKERPFRGRIMHEESCSWECGGRNRWPIVNPGQAKPHYVLQLQRNRATICTRMSTTKAVIKGSLQLFKDRCCLMFAHENWCLLDDRATSLVTVLLRKCNMPLKLSLKFIMINSMHSTLDLMGSHNTKPMFMVNLSSEDPIYDVQGP
ncbi:hypothetical protein Tco_0540436 [Tanacetum coccineum]